MPNRYEFHSTFSPEKLNWELRVLVRAHNSLYGKERPIHLKWKGTNEFTIRQTYISTYSGPWSTAGTDGRSISWNIGYGSSKQCFFQDPLRGEILPDGAGGSLLRVRSIPWTSRVSGFFGVVLLIAGVWMVKSSYWMGLLVLLFCSARFFGSVIKQGKMENHLELFALFKEKLSGPPL